jgi:hypothetical protein
VGLASWQNITNDKKGTGSRQLAANVTLKQQRNEAIKQLVPTDLPHG